MADNCTASDALESEKDEAEFLVFHPCSEEEKNNDFVWILFNSKTGEEKKQGFLSNNSSSSDNSISVILPMLERIVLRKGYVVAYQRKEIVEWMRQHLPDDTFKELWTRPGSFRRPGALNQFYVGSLGVAVMLDPDSYRPLSLAELQQLRFSELGQDDRDETSDSSASKAAARCVGTTFFWMFHRQYSFVENEMVFSDENIQLKMVKHHKRRGGPEERWNTVDDTSSTEGIKFVVLDLETHDWHAHGPQLSRKNAIGKIVEIAWICFDAQGMKVDSKAYLLKPNASHYTDVSTKARAYHAITTKCAKEQGVDAGLVFDMFEKVLAAIPEDGFVIAHNMNHEDAIMYSNLSPAQRLVWDKVPKCCTMDETLINRFVKHTPGCHGKKLTNVFQSTLDPKDHKQRALVESHHGALADAQMAGHIFFHYLEKIDADEQFTMDLLPWSRARLPGWTPFLPHSSPGRKRKQSSP